MDFLLRDDSGLIEFLPAFVSISTRNTNLPLTSPLSTLGRPLSQDVLTAQRTVELFQEYNDAIVQTIKERPF
jgi:hypothetical protein